MTELLTAAQMRAMEQAAISSGEVTGLELMERAGQGVVEAILEWRPELAKASHRAVVLCGPGNNGGDGFVVARLLMQRGWDVEVFLYGDETKLPRDAAKNAQRWREAGNIQCIFDLDRPVFNAADVVVDAIFGGGVARKFPSELHSELWQVFDPSPEEVHPGLVAIDGPSGLCLTSGRLLDWDLAGVQFVLSASLTVTFHSLRVGHMTGDGPSLCGQVSVADIGLSGFQRNGRWSPDVVQTPWLFPGWFAKASAHKYSHGHALILSGGSGKGGAARLAARGALRIGAGLVTVGCPEEALVENAARLDAIMLAPIKGVDGLQTELRERKVRAVCVGPGFGLGAQLREIIASLLARGPRAHPTKSTSVVLDADALTEFRDDPETLFGMLHQDCILTPHEGEFGRLFPDILAKLKEPATKGPAYSKVDATREAAKRAGCVVLFKGADTVIAHPDGRCSINSAHYERSAPWLATAGSGDVLAGFITGLLARGFDPMQAAETAAWLHVECALKFGPGMIAEDLPEQLPAVFRDLDV